jgi:hypothetical protein
MDFQIKFNVKRKKKLYRSLTLEAKHTQKILVVTLDYTVIVGSDDFSSGASRLASLFLAARTVCKHHHIPPHVHDGWQKEETTKLDKTM